MAKTVQDLKGLAISDMLSIVRVNNTNLYRTFIYMLRHSQDNRSHAFKCEILYSVLAIPF